MKVLQINSVCGIRSTGRICTDIAEILKQQGHSCMIAYGREEVPERYKSISMRTDSHLGVKLHALQSRIFDNSGFARARATMRLIKQIEAYGPDVIHLHNVHGYYINLRVLFEFLRRYNRPVVWTLHDCWAFTGHCTHFDRIACTKWKTQCENCPQKKRYPASYVFDRSSRNYALKKELFCGLERMVLVTPSHWLAAFVKESFLQDFPLQVIHNGVDLETFQPRTSDFREKHNLQGKKIVLGVASDFDRSKGFYDFIELSKQIDSSYQIVLVGLTPQQLGQLPEKILGIERTNNIRELAEIYSAADVFVNPTYEDNYPTTNLEAQCCETPVITYRTGGSIESVPAAQVVKQGDLAGLLNKIYEVCDKGCFTLNDRTLFDKNRAFSAYIDLYKELIL